MTLPALTPKPSSRVHQLLADLNVIRVEKLHLPQLKSWKGSIKSLEDTIAKHGTTVTHAPAAVAEGAYKNARDAEHRTGVKQQLIDNAPNPIAKKATRALLKDLKPKEEKVMTTKKTVKSVAPAPANANEVTLADIARELDINPKVARSKARRNASTLTKLQVKGKKYVYPKANAKKVREAIGA